MLHWRVPTVCEKVCSKCDVLKPLSHYHKMVNGYDGLRPNCKVCVLSARRLYVERNPTYNRDYLRANRDRMRKHWKEWSTEQKANDPLWARLRAALARAQGFGAPYEYFTGAELRSHWDDNGIAADRCFYTGEPLDDSWEIDHIHPLSREGTPGHVLANIVPASQHSNRSKHTKTAEEYALACKYREG